MRARSSRTARNRRRRRLRMDRRCSLLSSRSPRRSPPLRSSLCLERCKVQPQVRRRPRSRCVRSRLDRRGSRAAVASAENRSLAARCRRCHRAVPRRAWERRYRPRDLEVPSQSPRHRAVDGCSNREKIRARCLFARKARLLRRRRRWRSPSRRRAKNKARNVVKCISPMTRRTCRVNRPAETSFFRSSRPKVTA